MAKKKTGTTRQPYDVGRGKPPKSGQFPPGVSGNPGGRRKGSLNVKTVLEAVMGTEITVPDRGGSRTVSILEALLLRQTQEALKGQLRAIESLLDRFERLGGDPGPSHSEPNAEDLALLKEALEGLRSRRVPNRSAPAPEPDDDAGA